MIPASLYPPGLTGENKDFLKKKQAVLIRVLNPDILKRKGEILNMDYRK